MAGCSKTWRCDISPALWWRFFFFVSLVFFWEWSKNPGSLCRKYKWKRRWHCSYIIVFCILKIGPFTKLPFPPVFRRRSWKPSHGPTNGPTNGTATRRRSGLPQGNWTFTSFQAIRCLLEIFFCQKSFVLLFFLIFLRGGPDPIWDWMLDWGLEYLPIRFTIHLGAIHVGNFTISWSIWG